MKLQKKMSAWLWDALFFTLGSIIYALSVNVFTAPNNIAPGGMTGIATIFNYLWGLPIGLTILVCNLPLFLWGWKAMGFSFLAKTVVATVVSSVAIDLTAPYLPVYQGDMLLTTVFGGVLAGVGLSLIFVRGGTTGGTDLAAGLLGRFVPHISFGKMLLLMDLLVVAGSALVYRSLESPLYAIIVIYITTRVIDTALYGSDAGTGKMMFILSEKSGEIAAEIMKKLDHGVTKIPYEGGYSGRQGQMLLCAVRRHEVYHVFDIVHSLDPKAFLMVGDAGEIRGEGFAHIKKDSLF